MEPDFNVLPLITRFFRERYADQQWLIYDNKRRYGAYYDKRQLSEIELSVLDISSDSVATDSVTLDEQEALYAALWQDYFKSTNIASRKIPGYMYVMFLKDIGDILPKNRHSVKGGSAAGHVKPLR